ncbi:MAG: MFS transporter [Burkholderiaceae bacterium]|nr:MFS transporter [Burkholderiaceae bacterium]
MESILKIKSIHYIGIIFGIIAIGTESLIMSPLLKEIGESFGNDIGMTGWAVSAYGIALAITAPAIGLLCRKTARVHLMLVGMLVFFIASLWCGISNSFSGLVLARALCGMGAGLYIPSCYAWIGDHVPYEIRAQVMGRIMAGWSMALVLGVPFGTVLAEAFGWRSAFFAISAISLLALLGIFLLPIFKNEIVSRPSLRDEVHSILTGPSSKILRINFLNMLGFYSCYSFLGIATRESLQIGSALFGMLVICYGMGLMLSTMNGNRLDKLGKQKALWGSNFGLMAIFLLLPMSFTHIAAMALCMGAWGIFQGIAQTSTATLMTLSAGKSRGFALACMSSTTYLAVALGAGAGGWMMQYNGFSSITLMSLGTVFSVHFLIKNLLINEKIEIITPTTK